MMAYSSANTTASISVPTPPTAANDSYSLNEGAALTLDAAAESLLMIQMLKVMR